MGAVDQPQRQTKAKGKGLRRPKRRVGIRIDMTPMVDIAFLLLIFYMVTTIFSAPQSMEVVLPPKKTDVPPQPIPESKLLQILVDSDGNLFWQHTPPGAPKMELPQFIAARDLRQFLIKKNQETARLVTVLRFDKDCPYERMVDVFDEIQVVERLFKQADPSWSYRRSVQDMTNWEFQLIEKAKAAMGGVPKQTGDES